MFATAIAIGGLSPSEFDLLTWGELRAILERARVNEEQHDRMEWERARHISFRICGPYLKKGTKLNDFWPLPWDRRELAPASSVHRILQEISK